MPEKTASTRRGPWRRHGVVDTHRHLVRRQHRAFLGASYVSAASQPIESLADRTGEFDVVLEAVGFAPVMMAASRLLHANGVAVLTGIPAEGAATELVVGRFLRDLVLKNQAVFGTVNAGRRDYFLAIQLLEQFMTLFPDSVRKLITHRFPLGDAARMLTDRDGIKNVVQLHPLGA